MNISNKVFKQLSENISVNYALCSINSETGEEKIDENGFGVVISNCETFFRITKGDDGWYNPIYPEEIEEVKQKYGESYVSKGFPYQTIILDSNGEVDIEKSPSVYHILEQPEYFYVMFQPNFAKTNKFLNVEDAIKYAFQKQKEFLLKELNNLNYLDFELNNKKY